MDHENFNHRQGWNSEVYNISDRIKNGDFEIVEFLIDKYGICHQAISCSLLCTALESNQKDIAKLLLSKGAKVNPPEFKSKLDDIPYTPLHYAVSVCDKEIMESLLQRGATVNAKAGPRNSTPLFECVFFEKTDMMEILLRNGADLNIPAGNGETPLQCAVGGGYTDATKILLDHGANPNDAIDYAAEVRELDIVKLLLSYGARINSKCHNDLLHTAVLNRDGQLLESLLKCGADVDGIHSLYATVLCVVVLTGDPALGNIVLKYGPALENIWNQAAVHFAVRKQRESMWPFVYGEIIENFVSYGFKILDKDAASPMLLLVAIRNAYEKTIEEVFSRRSNLEVLRNSFLAELLQLYPSTLSDKSKVAKILVKYRTEKNTRYRYCAEWDEENRPFFWNMCVEMFELLLTDRGNVKNNPNLMKFAVCMGHLDIVKYLLHLGIDVNAQDSEGMTALHFSVLQPGNRLWPVLRLILGRPTPSTKIVNFLLSQNANVNAANRWGETPLLIAAENNLIEIINVLVSAKADINAADGQGSTALHHLARFYSNYPVIKDLLWKGADPNARGKDDLTPLHIASKENKRRVVKLLLKYGGDINCQYKNGTPLHVACRYGNRHVVKYLVEYGADVNATVGGATPMDHATMTLRNFNIPEFPYYFYPSQYTHSSYSRPITFLSQHLAKMKAANLFLNDENLKYTGQRFYQDFQTHEIWTGLRNSAEYEPSRYQTECEKEVALLKRDKFVDSNFSFYDVLVGSEKLVMKLSANKNLVQEVCSANFQASFPKYASWIKGRILNGKWMRKLREKCMNQILSAIAPRRLPSLCIERIIDNLTVVDLRKLADFPQCPS